MTAHVAVREAPARPHARADVEAFFREKKGEIEALLARYPERKAGMLPLLWMLQHRFGWLSTTVQREAARALGVAPGEVSRVVSFYSLFTDRPLGRFVLFVCGTLPCALVGAEAVIRALEEELGVRCGGTTPDRLFTLRRVECLGWCDRAPLLQVNEGDYEDHLTPEKAVALVRRLRQKRAS